MGAGRVVVWCVISMIFLPTPVAVAQTDRTFSAPTGGAFRMVCDNDLLRFCSGVRPGGGRLIRCLSAHTAELSDACVNVIATAGAGGRLRAACGNDLKRLCPGVQAGDGRLVQCLLAHNPEVSTACKIVIAAVRVREGPPDLKAQGPAAHPAAPVTGTAQPVAMGSILRASCGPDAQRLCPAARKEADVLKCLDNQHMELSAECNLYFQRLSAQPIAQKNVPAKNPVPSSPIPPTTRPNDKSPPQPNTR